MKTSLFLKKGEENYHYNLKGPYSERFLEINEDNFEEYMKRKYKSIVYVVSGGNEKVMKFYENNGFKMTGYTMKMQTE